MKFYGWLLLGVCFIVYGCTKPEIDEVMLATQFQDAQQAINNAGELASGIIGARGIRTSN